MITSINGVKVNNTADLLEQVGIHRPGDEVKIVVDRNGRDMKFDVVLANRKGTKEILASNEMEVMDQLGATFKDLSRAEAEQLGIEGGVKIESLASGILKSQTQLKPGFIITAVNNQEVNSVEELEKILENTDGGVLMEGTYEDYPGKIYVAFGLDK